MKVAAYCRVSTDREDQANSFESQQRYFRDYIRAQPGWTLYRIYADEGITGTSTARRTAFHQMIRDAERHLFDLILTKEVSRFSPQHSGHHFIHPLAPGHGGRGCGL